MLSHFNPHWSVQVLVVLVHQYMCSFRHGSGRKAKARVKDRRGHINKRDKDQVDILQYQIPLATRKGGSEILPSDSSLSIRWHTVTTKQALQARHLPDQDSQLSLLYWRKFFNCQLGLRSPGLFSHHCQCFDSQSHSQLNVACVKKVAFRTPKENGMLTGSIRNQQFSEKQTGKGTHQDSQHDLGDAIASTNLEHQPMLGKQSLSVPTRNQRKPHSERNMPSLNRQVC